MIRRTPDLDELDREIRDHIEEETLDNIARGMSEDDARAAAIRKFGNVVRVKEDVRGVWVPGWLDRLRQDARDAVRHLRRNPGFSFAIILTLALGIGLTTAIYSVVNAVLLRPLAYSHPERTVWVATRAKGSQSERAFMTSIEFGAWRPQVTTLEHMVAYDYADATVVVGDEASRVRIVAGSKGFWEMTGAQVLLGKLQTEDERDVLAITHRVFREQFRSDPGVIGRVISVDGRPLTIAAVLQEDFQPQLLSLSLNVDIDQIEPGAYRLMKVEPPPKVFTPSTAIRVFQAMGELKPGVTIEQARAEIETIHSREPGSPFGPSEVLVTPLQEKIVGPSRRALGILLSASLVVLLITCANVANLLLSRAAARRKEIALRMSVGSGPLRVVRQLLAESLGYAVLGGLAGVTLASWLIDAVISVMGPAVPRLAETRLDVGVLAVAAALSIGTALLFGVGPALALVFTNVQEVLKEGGRSVSASRRVLLTGRTMVAIQIALTVVLVAGAGLMFKSIWQMTTYPTGFAPDQILTMRVDFRGPQYREAQARRTTATALLEKARSLPGVRQAALTGGNGSLTLLVKEGETIARENRERRTAASTTISEGFGPMLGMTMASGRWFADGEATSAVVINESLARRDFPDSNPIGTRIRRPSAGPESYSTIIGVARDLKYDRLDADAMPEVFYPYLDERLFGVTVTMRIDGDPVAAAPAIRKALSSVDPTQSFYAVRTMEQALAQAIAPRRFNLLLLGTFALVALVLAAVGVYGVVGYGVAERTQEIGIRLALGAERSGVVGMIIVQGMLSVIVGLTGGVLAAWGATRFIEGMLYGVQPHDLPTFVLVTVSLAAVALVACALPALRAALVQPAIALRAD
jgi:putative ABC transport system permease protein